MPDPGEVYIEIDGNAWDYWTEVTLEESADSISKVSFSGPFEPERDLFRQTFKPFSYSEVTLSLGGTVRFVGTMMRVNPQLSADERTIGVEAYARCGVLNDVTPLETQLPTEFLNQSLEQIAKQLCEPLGINVVFGAPSATVIDLDAGTSFSDPEQLDRINPGTPFEKVQLKPGAKVLQFLIELAKQRALIVRSTPDGDLLFTRANEQTGDVVATLTDSRPVISITPRFRVQDYYSSLTGISKTKGGKLGSRFSVQNPRLEDNFDVQRPFVYELNDTDPADTQAAVEARLGRMFADAISYNVEVATTTDQSGRYWEPDRYVTLEAPGVMVYKKSPFLIRSTQLRFTPSESTASLSLVLPGTLSGKAPEEFPWEE
jgi:prophage tail gpP-like protein